MNRKILFFVILGLITAALTIGGCRLFSTHIDTSDTYTQSLLKDKAVKEVRAKINFWWFCFGDPTAFVTVGETIYVDRETWLKDINSRRTTFLQATLTHESMHVLRQSKMGLTTWLSFYVFSKSFRWEEEKAAHRAGWVVEVARGVMFDTYDSFAKYVSGPAYYGMVSYDEAYKFMVDTFAELRAEKAKKQ